MNVSVTAFSRVGCLSVDEIVYQGTEWCVTPGCGKARSGTPRQGKGLKRRFYNDHNGSREAHPNDNTEIRAGQQCASAFLSNWGPALLCPFRA